MGNRLPLLPVLGPRWCLGPSGPCAVRASACCSRACTVPKRGDHGRTIGKTTERGGVRGFDAHKPVKGRKRHILVDTLGIPIACRVEPADISDRRVGARLLRGLSSLFPRIRAVFADAGHESRKLARDLLRWNGWKLKVVKRKQRAFKITGLTWVVERGFAWLGRNRRLSKDYEYRVQTSELMIDLAATRLMLNRLASR
jgi:putative transposase